MSSSAFTSDWAGDAPGLFFIQAGTLPEVAGVDPGGLGGTGWLPPGFIQGAPPPAGGFCAGGLKAGTGDCCTGVVVAEDCYGVDDCAGCDAVCAGWLAGWSAFFIHGGGAPVPPGFGGWALLASACFFQGF